MREQPTPETDAHQHEGLLRTNPIPMQVVTANFARKLERERDELREILQAVIKTGKRLESERDEARAKLDDWENAAKHVESDHSDEVHCSCVPVLRKLLNDSKKERDEAREALASREVVLAQQRVITDLILERDQSRAVLQEIEAARWHTACELRRIATMALGSKT